MKDVRLIVPADEPALFFSSMQAAERYLEPVDVQNGIYPIAYGPAGEIYRIGVRDGRVAVTLDSAQHARPDELKRLITHFLSAAEVPAPTGDLAALVKACACHLSA
jgi:hypothetical protein